MVKLVFVLVVWLLFLSQVWAALQKITIYEQPDQNGDSHTFTKKYPDLADYKFFLNRTGSFCLTGYWYFWNLPNFEYSSNRYYKQSTTEICENLSFAEFNSGGYYGPEDFDTPAISLHEGSNLHYVGGQEVVVTGPAGNNIQFTPAIVHSWGNSSWTLFTGKNFDGNSMCFTPNRRQPEYVYTGYTNFNSAFVVQSVVKGCDKVQVSNNINIFKNSLNLK